METVKISDMRGQISPLADQVCHHGKRIWVERNGRPVFVMVSVEDCETLEALEDKLDLQAVRKALKDDDWTSHEELKKELGL